MKLFSFHWINFDYNIFLYFTGLYLFFKFDYLHIKKICITITSNKEYKLEVCKKVNKNISTDIFFPSCKQTFQFSFYIPS